MTTPIDAFRPDPLPIACDPSAQCCPDARDEQVAQAPVDVFLPGAAIAGAVTWSVRGMLEKSIQVLQNQQRRLDTRAWIDDLSEPYYDRLYRTLGDRLAKLPVFRRLSDDAQSERIVDLIVDVVAALEAEPWFEALSFEEQEGARERALEQLEGMMALARFRDEAFDAKGRITPEGVARIVRLAAPMKPLYPPAGSGDHADVRDLKNKPIVDALAAIFARLRLHEQTIEPTPEALSDFFKGMDPINPQWKPIVEELFRRFNEHPHAKAVKQGPTAEDLVRIFKKLDPNDPRIDAAAADLSSFMKELHARWRPAFAVFEAHRILEAQAWFAPLSKAERAAVTDELNRTLVQALSSAIFRREGLNADGFVKTGALRELVATLEDLPREMREAPAKGRVRWQDREVSWKTFREIVASLRSRGR